MDSSTGTQSEDGELLTLSYIELRPAVLRVNPVGDRILMVDADSCQIGRAHV